MRPRSFAGSGEPPRILVTVADPARSADNAAAATRKSEAYADSVRRHGAEPVVIDATAGAAERAAALATTSGLLLTGGADIDPARYGQPLRGAVDLDPERDELEAGAWAAAERDGRPVLGICRGFEAINVFSGGTLLQDVAGHEHPGGGDTGREHPLRVVPGTRLARILFPTNVRGGVLRVNSHHHQAVTPAGLAAGLLANAMAASPAGDLVEGLESTGERLILGVQCHPERVATTPPAFERLFAFFVDACRGSALDRSDRRAGDTTRSNLLGR